MKRHPNYSGGSITASNGYKLVFVGKEHHLADVRGYAYEHRLEAEKKIGRRLLPGEQVHHVNGDKQNNAHENLMVKESLVHHKVEHRAVDSKLRLPGEQNTTIECACGCGQKFEKYDASGRPRKFAVGHARKGKPRTWEANSYSKMGRAKMISDLNKARKTRYVKKESTTSEGSV